MTVVLHALVTFWSPGYVNLSVHPLIVEVPVFLRVTFATKPPGHSLDFTYATLHVAPPLLALGEADGDVDGEDEGEAEGDADGDVDGLVLGLAEGLPELLLPEITYVTSERAGMPALNAPPVTGIAVCAAALFEPLVSTGVAVPLVIPAFCSE